jgi:cytochrome P450
MDEDSSPLEASLPPGEHEIPIVGDTLTILHNPFSFIEERRDEFGPVFHANILNRDTAIMTGPDACAAFIDPANIKRTGAQPEHVARLMAGITLATLDGEAHLARKYQILQAFTPEMLAGYLPIMQQHVEAMAQGWAAADEVRGLDELRRLAIGVIGAAMTGLEPGPRLAGLQHDYSELLRGLLTLPVDLPGTQYHDAVAALPRILSTLSAVVAEHRAQPTADGLSRILAARAPNGEQLGDPQAARELHHLFVAGFVLHAPLVALIMQLSAHPAVRARALDEVARLAPAGPVTLDQLAAMPYLTQVALEVKRICPAVPMVFGEALRTFEFNEHSIPTGWRVFLGIYATDMNEEIYTRPADFDPDRFSSERAEDRRHPYAFVPHGAGEVHTTHRCPGVDFATYIMMILAIVLLRDYTWELPPQDLDYVWAESPPPPKDGLRLRVQRRPAPAAPAPGDQQG